MREKLKEKSQTYHIFIHIFLGILTSLAVFKLFPAANLTPLLILGITGNLLPDVDHIIYFLTYGKKTEYSEIVKQLLSEKQIGNLRKFLRENHKYLTGLYSHTLLSPLVTSLLSFYFLTRKEPYLLALTLSISIHFFYDILEDLIFFGKLNKNWYLRVEKPR